MSQHSIKQKCNKWHSRYKRVSISVCFKRNMVYMLLFVRKLLLPQLCYWVLLHWHSICVHFSFLNVTALCNQSFKMYILQKWQEKVKIFFLWFIDIFFFYLTEQRKKYSNVIMADVSEYQVNVSILVFAEYAVLSFHSVCRNVFFVCLSFIKRHACIWAFHREIHVGLLYIFYNKAC